MVQNDFSSVEIVRTVACLAQNACPCLFWPGITTMTIAADMMLRLLPPAGKVIDLLTDLSE
jgi:hypothetical protein